MATGFTILFSSFFFLLIGKSFCDFPSDFLGNYLSDEEYNNRTLCRTAVCLKDSGRLIYDADHDSTQIVPCDDFKTFAMGTFFKHRVVNDRYPFSGFLLDVSLQYYEKLKRMLLKPIDQREPKMFRFMKTWFSKCINSSEIFCS